MKRILKKSHKDIETSEQHVSPELAAHHAAKKHHRRTQRTRVILLVAYLIAGVSLLIGIWGIVTVINYSDASANDAANNPELVGVVLPKPSQEAGNIRPIKWVYEGSGSSTASINGNEPVTLALGGKVINELQKQFVSSEAITTDFDYFVNWTINTWCTSTTCEVYGGVIAGDDAESQQRVQVSRVNSPIEAIMAEKLQVGSAPSGATYVSSGAKDSAILIARRGNQIITYAMRDGNYRFVARESVSGQCCKLYFGGTNTTESSLMNVTFTKYELRD